jgi:hypothetical protein
MRWADFADKPLDLVNCRGCWLKSWFALDRDAGYSTARPVFLRRNRFRFAEFRSLLGRSSYFVSINYDYGARAQAALRWAMAATCERERLSWVRVALAWQDLDRGDEDATISIASMYSLSFAAVLPSDHPRPTACEDADKPRRASTLQGFQIIKRRVHPPAAR